MVIAVLGTSHQFPRLIKADMPVLPQSKQLQVGKAHSLNHFIILCTGRHFVCCQTVRHMRIPSIDIDFTEKMTIHEMAVTLVVVRRKTTVLIQIYRLHTRKIQFPLFAFARKNFIGANRSAPGRKPQHTIRFHHHHCADQLCHSPADTRIILFYI